VIEKNNILHCHLIKNINIVKADGVYLYSDKDKRYVDFESGIWCASLGHCNKSVNETIRKQILSVMHLNTSLVSNEARELADKLLKLHSIENGKALFLSSGSEAVEFSTRVVKEITSNKKLITFSESYLSAYNNSYDWKRISFVKCDKCIKTKECYNCDLLKRIDFSKIGGFVFEPGSSSGRVMFPSLKLVKYIAKKIKENEGFIIVNEVTTGFGRTGKWFGYQHYDIKPDIVAMGKALGNGYPVSGVIMSKEIASLIENSNFRYAQSHQNDPLGCAIASVVIDELNSNDMINISHSKGLILKKTLENIKSPLIKEVRGKGLMCAMELIKDGLANIIYDKMLEKGFAIGITPQANVLRFFPAFVITEHEIKEMSKALQGIFHDI